MANALFTQEEMLALEAIAIRHRRKAATVPVDTVIVFGLAAFLGLVGFTEYSLFHEVFAYLKGPALPGAESPWSINLLALTGTLMMAGFHVYARQHPRSAAVRLIERCTGLFLPVYALGAGLAVASIIYFDGADSLVTQAAESSQDLFAAADQAASPSFDRLLSLFPVVFSLGCGGLAIINLFVAHRLIEEIGTRAARAWRRALAGLEAHAAIKTVRAAQRRHADLMARRNALAAMGEAEHRQAVANDVIDAINAAVRPYENHLIDLRIRGNGPDNRFAVQPSNIDPKELAKRVNALRAITMKSVLAALRGAKE
jgi:hypothetical protein